MRLMTAMHKNSATLQFNGDFSDKQTGTMAEQIARAVCDFQCETTGHCPKAVSVVLGDDTLVITRHEALTPAEKASARNAEGAAKVQEFHRQLYATSSESLQKDIRRITGRQLQEAMTDVEPTAWAMKHVFTTGTIMQMFRLAPGVLSETGADGDSNDLQSRRVTVLRRAASRQREHGGTRSGQARRPLILESLLTRESEYVTRR